MSKMDADWVQTALRPGSAEPDKQCNQKFHLLPIGMSGDTSVAHGNREVPGGGAFQNDARIADRAVAAVHSYHPSSNVVTPNTRSSVSARIAPVYIRAVSNTGKSSRSCASATASSLTLGTSRKISRAPAAAIRAARTASAAARSSAMSGPILL